MATSIREYAYLVSSGAVDGLDRQVIAKADYDFLRSCAIRNSSSAVFRLTTNLGQEAIQAQNFVGVVALPSGDQLEIVPKTTIGQESVQHGREVLLKMLGAAKHLNFREGGLASLQALERPWIEALIDHLLKMIASVTRSGLRKDYVRVQAVKPFLKGQLRVAAQLRQRLGRQHYFHVAYDDYSTNRPENRLLRSALERLSNWTKRADSQRLCTELLFYMDEVPPSRDHVADLRGWSHGRDMARYTPLLPWVRLILTNRSPFFSEGRWEGISLLFPMERLFEQYVAKKLQETTRSPFRLRAQVQSQSLVKHREQPYFRLKPDLAIMVDNRFASILDTKWKLIDQTGSGRASQYGLSQADFYQLYAYGEKYLDGRGDVFLIFPRHPGFESALAPFHFNEQLRLWVVPFNLDTDNLEWPQSIDLENSDFQAFTSRNAVTTQPLS